MRVAIVHYWLIGMRGGEKTIEQLCHIYPQADIFTHVLDSERISPHLNHRVKATTFINRLPAAKRLYKFYLPLMPLALEQLDLREYDLVISSESGPAKGVLVSSNAVHICYCHSPMRYIWDMYQGYLSSAGRIKRVALRMLSHYLRIWDVTSAARVDHFVANSSYVAKRIRRSYNRNAEVIYPPVDVRTFRAHAEDVAGDFYLMVGELVDYKRFDLGIEAAKRLGRRLLIVGSGELKERLARMAGPGVTLLGAQTNAELRRLYATCRALIFPGEEDFGIVPVEAMASGRPVVAYRKGGATESVKADVTGIFFEHQTVEALCGAILRLEERTWDSDAIRRHAATFSVERFRSEMRAFINRSLDDPSLSAPPDDLDEEARVRETTKPLLTTY